MTTPQRTLDVADMPDHAFGHQGLIWWGTIGFMVIEGSMFAIVLIAYFYLRLKVTDWPPSLPDPRHIYGTANLCLVVASCVPAALAKRAAERYELAPVRRWLGILTLMGVLSVVLRAYEFPALQVRWDDAAYGSITWLLLGLHTMHVVTDVVDSAVLLALMWIGPVTASRFVDVSENSLYWYFVVTWWLPIYLTIYFAPRWL